MIFVKPYRENSMSWLDILGFSGQSQQQHEPAGYLEVPGARTSSPTREAPAEWTTTDGENAPRANGARIIRHTARPLSPTARGPDTDVNSSSTSYSPGIDYYQRRHVTSQEKIYISSPDRAHVSEQEKETYISSPDRTYVRPMEIKVPYSYSLSPASNEAEVRHARPGEVRFVGERTLQMADQEGWARHTVDQVPVPTSRVDYRSVDHQRRVNTVTVLSAL